MPLTESGKEVLRSMTKQYGKKKAKRVFYSSINKGVKGSEQWHESKRLGDKGKRRLRRLASEKARALRKA